MSASNVTYLRQPRVPKNMEATRLDGNPLGSGTVIGRDAPAIPVMHQDASGLSCSAVGSVTAVPVPEPTASAPLPPDAGERRSKPEFQVDLDQTLPQSSGIAVPAPPNPKVFVPPQPQPAAQPQLPASAPVTKRVRVRMSNRGMGRVSVSVRAVSISDTCVVLAYPKDADNIIEPPVCGGDNPIKVEYDGNSYLCVFGGWTTELEDMFLVILLITEPDPKG